MVKHTKGIWQVLSAKYSGAPKEIITGVGIEIEDDYFRVLFNTVLPDSDKEYIKEHDEIKANCNLIAAAPEMYNILMSILTDGSEGRNNIDIVNLLNRINND